MSTGQIEGNLSRFIRFRVFFNARFYYPVFTILYLDYGLTLEQFAILNMVWAVTIVVAEVPSGALADLVGRRYLLVFAAVLMVIEMSLLVFVPIGASPLLFMVFLLNRVCSGLAEAAASGADEALAYDSLVRLGREDDWPALLERTARYMSAAFFTNMIVGALSYDQRVINTLLGWLNPDWSLPAHIIIRLPVVLTLCTSFIVLATTLRMVEVPHQESSANPQPDSLRALMGRPFRQILKAGTWTIRHHFVLLVILGALALDSVARQFVVLASEYYRIIEIPTAWFGFIGAGMSLIGLVNARISKHLVTHHSPFFNFLVLSAILTTGLTGILFTLPWFGVFFAIGAFSMMGMVAYQSSYYINKEVDSAHRATVLSFRGLALNLGLGMASLLYTVLIAVLKSGQPGLEGKQLQQLVFVDSLKAFPLYFALLFLGILLLGRFILNRPRKCFIKPPAKA